MKKQLLAGVLAVGLPWAAWADGKVFHASQTYARIPIPDQQALICFSNGVEHLIIETSFIARGTNFAWVVPVPSEPTVTASTRGLFPTLRALFRPTVKTEISPEFGLVTLGFVLAYLVLAVRRTGRLTLDDATAAFVAVLGCLGLAGGLGLILGPWLGGVLLLEVRASRRGSGWASVLVVGLGIPFMVSLLLPALASAGAEPPKGVTVTARQRAGIFETTTLHATDPQALQRWLQTNGFALPLQLGRAVSNYVRDGWFFVASKACVEAEGLNTNSLHPLAFSFRTPRPVYPLQLTGVDNDRCRVDLFVFGPSQASAPNFRTVRCESLAPEAADADHPTARRPLQVRHSELRRWVGDLPVATQLTATLSAADMQEDAWLNWQPVREQGSAAYAKFTAFSLAANVAGSLLLLGLLAFTPAWRNPTRERTVTSRRRLSWAAALVVGAVIYFSLPRVAVDVRQGGARWMHIQADVLENVFACQEYRPGQDEALVLKQLKKDRRLAFNPYLGGAICFEDSPGNLAWQLRDGALEVCQHDSDGAPQVVYPRAFNRNGAWRRR